MTEMKTLRESGGRGILTSWETARPRVLKQGQIQDAGRVKGGFGSWRGVSWGRADYEEVAEAGVLDHEGS